MNRKLSALSIIFLVISVTASSAIFARGGAGGFSNRGDRGLNNNGYDNSFYYNRHLNDYNGVAVFPDDADADSSCQTTQVCDSSGTCVTQQNCD